MLSNNEVLKKQNIRKPTLNQRKRVELSERRNEKRMRGEFNTQMPLKPRGAGGNRE